MQGNSPFTTVVAVDAGHCSELATVWPTWHAHRPDILEAPLLVLADGVEDEVRGILSGHDQVEVVPVAEDAACPDDSQRGKMLWSLLVQAPVHVTTQKWVKLDCDTLATGPGTPLTEFEPTDVIAPPWPYSKPNDALLQLDAWYGAEPWEGQHCRMGHSRERERVYFPRIIGWLSVIDTAFSREVAEYVETNPPPLVSHDTLLWYLGRRWHEQERIV